MSRWENAEYIELCGTVLRVVKGGLDQILLSYIVHSNTQLVSEVCGTSYSRSRKSRNELSSQEKSTDGGLLIFWDLANGMASHTNPGAMKVKAVALPVLLLWQSRRLPSIKLCLSSSKRCSVGIGNFQAGRGL